MAVYIGTVVIVASATSFLFYYITRRIGLFKKSLIVAVTSLNILFCSIFPLLFALVSGKTPQNTPLLDFRIVLGVLGVWLVVYISAVVWRVVLHSPSVSLNAPIPPPDPLPAGVAAWNDGANEPDAVEVAENIYAAGPGGPDGAGGSPGRGGAAGRRREGGDADTQGAPDSPTPIDDIIEKPLALVLTQKKIIGKDAGFLAEKAVNNGLRADFIKNPVDTAQNIDKMGMATVLRADSGENELFASVVRADELYYSKQYKEAAGYLYKSLEMRPSLSLEIQIAIRLSVIYYELGHVNLSLDILDQYYDQYRSRLSHDDRASLEAGISAIGASAAGNGGDGYEKN